MVSAAKEASQWVWLSGGRGLTSNFSSVPCATVEHRLGENCGREREREQLQYYISYLNLTLLRVHYTYQLGTNLSILWRNLSRIDRGAWPSLKSS